MLNYISSQILNFKLKNIATETSYVKSLPNKILLQLFFQGQSHEWGNDDSSGGNEISYVENFL